MVNCKFSACFLLKNNLAVDFGNDFIGCGECTGILMIKYTHMERNGVLCTRAFCKHSGIFCIHVVADADDRQKNSLQRHIRQRSSTCSHPTVQRPLLLKYSALKIILSYRGDMRTRQFHENVIKTLRLQLLRAAVYNVVSIFTTKIHYFRIYGIILGRPKCNLWCFCGQ